MATNEDERLLKCSTCENDLNFNSKTLPCLHSFCESCISGIGQCPQCDESFKTDQLTLLPFLLNSLKSRQMELKSWKCDRCLKDEKKDSMATNWCHDCGKFFCENCNRLHNSFLNGHNSVELDKNGRKEVRKSMRTDLCLIHNKMKEFYCNKCKNVFCDICHREHLKNSPQCRSCSISVNEEALKIKQFQGPTLMKEISDLENYLRERNVIYNTFIDDMEIECSAKCKDIWSNFEIIIEELRVKMHEMCNDLRKLKNGQVKKWRQLLAENERILKKLVIWRIHLSHLLKKNENEKTDIVCGVDLLKTTFQSSLSSSGPHPKQKITEPVRKCELEVNYSNYYLQFLNGLKNEILGSSFLKYSENLIQWNLPGSKPNRDIQFEKEWNLSGSKPDLYIQSIIVSEEDGHIFLADRINRSIIELNESGEIVFEFCLKHEGKEFIPSEMFFISPKILVVNCWGVGEGGLIGERNLIFLKRKNVVPFLKIEKIVKTGNYSSFSVCQLKNKILICDSSKFKISFYTEEVEYLKTIDTGESGGRRDGYPLIRADPSTGNFWGAQQYNCKIFYFDENGGKLQLFKTKEKILDFSSNEFGEIYFCNFEGIFEFFPEKNLEKNLHKFQKYSETEPKIFVSREKIFVFLEIDQNSLIKIFKFI